MLATVVIAMALFTAPESSYLQRTAHALESARAEIPAMQTPAEILAARITSGGKLFAGGNPSLISEVCGRAGGLMLIGGLVDQVAEKDAVIFFAGTEHPLPDALKTSGAAV